MLKWLCPKRLRLSVFQAPLHNPAIPVTMCFVRHGDSKAEAKKGLAAFADMDDYDTRKDILMNILIHILFIAMALLLLWCLMLLPRKGQSGWEKLADVRYAHRGLHDMSQNIPENSLTAFRKAVENGFWGGAGRAPDGRRASGRGP